MLYLHKGTANYIALGELGQNKIEVYIKQRMLNYSANQGSR